MKDNKIRILLDLDNVMFNFDYAVIKLFRLDIKSPAVIEAAAAKNLERFVGTTDYFWEQINNCGESFWAELELLPWAQRLWDLAYAYAPKGVFICTAPSHHPHCLSGKLKSLHRHFGQIKNYVITKHKYLLAKPNVLLVDDTSRKIDEFIAEGGKGFLWPNPLSLINDKDLLDWTFNELINRLDDFYLE